MMKNFATDRLVVGIAGTGACRHGWRGGQRPHAQSGQRPTLLLQPATMPKRRPITVEDLWAIERLGPPSLSPDGRQLAYVSRQCDPAVRLRC